MRYHCLHCNCAFNEWHVFEGNNALICPLCGIAENCGQYEVKEGKTTRFNGFQYIGTTQGVCGGEPIILGRRLLPHQIVAYGTIEEVMEDFELTREQVVECYRYLNKIQA